MLAIWSNNVLACDACARPLYDTGACSQEKSIMDDSDGSEHPDSAGLSPAKNADFTSSNPHTQLHGAFPIRLQSPVIYWEFDLNVRSRKCGTLEPPTDFELSSNRYLTLTFSIRTIRTGPAWELWPKPSCCERRPVSNSGTHIGWDGV
ncbi:hypothetical protein MSG28_013956 [Choristoneura fumiferana]|uniref:Uncharacterized protein n=1 Tax=Choristoneura fumiferana TaxID=7141 RepID=A0ACC0K9U1_CHOFU|nr:hypothetical protein MSG28_013956 [Choristoneura fumiferana]